MTKMKLTELMQEAPVRLRQIGEDKPISAIDREEYAGEVVVNGQYAPYDLAKRLSGYTPDVRRLCVLGGVSNNLGDKIWDTFQLDGKNIIAFAGEPEEGIRKKCYCGKEDVWGASKYLMFQDDPRISKLRINSPREIRDSIEEEGCIEIYRLTDFSERISLQRFFTDRDKYSCDLYAHIWHTYARRNVDRNEEKRHQYNTCLRIAEDLSSLGVVELSNSSPPFEVEDNSGEKYHVVIRFDSNRDGHPRKLF
jgi:hypothetical protein